MNKCISNVKHHEKGIFTFTMENTWLSRKAMCESYFGWGNGYIALPIGHFSYGLDYDIINNYVLIHGGFTYSEEQEHDGNKYWVLGFDTAHLGDSLEKWPEKRVAQEIESVVEYFIK